jgi:hypothetical protein
MTTADLARPPLSEADHRAQLRPAVIASILGTTIEWYDFPSGASTSRRASGRDERRQGAGPINLWTPGLWSEIAARGA